MAEEFEIDDDLHPIDPPPAGACACACHHDNPLVQVAHVAPCCYTPIEPGPLLTDYLEKQRKANPMAGPWVDLDEHGRKIVLDWLIGTCLAFGASIGTAYQVAGLFASGLDREAQRSADDTLGQTKASPAASSGGRPLPSPWGSDKGGETGG